MAIRSVAIILFASVLLVFFAPAAAGPFSAVHGPATALRANRAAHVFYFNLALPARCLAAAMMFSLAAHWVLRSVTPVVDIATKSPLSALRC